MKSSLTTKLVAIALIFSLTLCMVCVNVKVHENQKIELSEEKLDFIDTLQTSYKALGKKAELEDFDHDQAIMVVTDRSGVQKRYLFDLNKETVLVSDFKGRLNKNTYGTVYADEISENTNAYVYDDDGRIIEIKRQNMSYGVNYDEHGRNVGEIINGDLISEVIYNDDGKIDREIYNNGDMYTYYYADGKCMSKSLNGKEIATYDYADDKLARYYDVNAGIGYSYSYNDDGKVSSMVSDNGYTVVYDYNDSGEITGKNYSLNGHSTYCVMSETGIISDVCAASNKTDIADRIVDHTLKID